MDVGRLLHALSRGCDSAAHALISPSDSHESIPWRYAHAAAGWPGALDRAGPSHERQTQLLASFHDTAAALRTAAACCARTSQLLAETMEAPASMPELEHRRATPKAAWRSPCAPRPSRPAARPRLARRITSSTIAAAISSRRRQPSVESPTLRRRRERCRPFSGVSRRRCVSSSGGCRTRGDKRTDCRAELRLQGFEGETEVRAHAARLCEPSDRPRRCGARISRGSLARRACAGGRKGCVSTASGESVSGNGVSPETDARCPTST